MTNQEQYNWNEDRFVDDVEFHPEEAKTFQALLSKKTEETKENLNTTGSILKGTVVEITKDFVVVDVGLKSEGLVPTNEFSDTSVLTLGNEVEVLLESFEGHNGQIILSRDKAERQRKWEYILEHCTEGSVISGVIIRKVKGGLMVDIGMEAFLPGSQIDNKRITNLDEYLNQKFDFKILKINIERKNVVVSRRALIEEERLSKKTSMLENIKEGDICRGSVKNITDFGVFLDLDGIDGLLHITDMTWKRIRHPSEIVKLGDELDVMILNIDREKGRVALGLKQKENNPWEKIEEKYPVGTRVTGTIVNLLPYGAFIEIEPGIEGLIHVSEMSWVKNITNPSEVVNKGDEVEAVVLSIQKDEGKISLGLKQAEHNPWDDVEEKYSSDTIVKAEIRNLTNYGAFVELEPGVDGLIHISDLSWIKKVSHPSEVLKKGDIVEAKVISVDKESKKITLGIKQLSDNPWKNVEEKMSIGSLVTGQVVKTTAFGAFVILDNGLEGLVHVTELSDQAFGRVEDVVSKGDNITAKVIKIDPEHKKIALSIKEFLIDKSQYNSDDIVMTRNEDNEQQEENTENTEN
jgi:small subunit ribosomal protein S1